MSFFKRILGNDPIKPLEKIADQVEALELTDGQKQIVDKLMATMEDLHDTQLSIIYAAGIIDSLVFIKERGLLDKVFRCM